MASEDKIKSYHIFISYRVATDGPLAERLADKLQLKALPNDPQLHVTCFFDQQNLKAGEAYYDDLRRGGCCDCWASVGCLCCDIYTDQVFSKVAFSYL